MIHLIIGYQYERELLPSSLIEQVNRIRSVKIFRVVQERFRLNSKKYQQVILMICGIVRLRIGALILPPETHAIPSR